MRWPKPLFVLLLALLAVSVYAALNISAGDPPALALNSELVLRVEVGAVVFLAGYALAAMLTIGYDGEFARRLGLPGGAGIETQQEGESGGRGGYRVYSVKPSGSTSERRTVASKGVERSRALADDMQRHGDGVVRNLRRAARALARTDRRAA